VPTRGVVYVHSSPLAVAPHVEWAIARVLGTPVRLEWTTQPVDGSRRTECTWSGRPGTAAELAAEMRAWPMLRFEVTEEPSPGFDGERFMHVPARGLFHAATGASGDLVLGEDLVRSLIAAARVHEGLAHSLEKALGGPWDAELEPYRLAGEGAPATWLTRVG
jgi:hypothetical protein